MARPTKWRKIESIPTVSYFVPSNRDFPQGEKADKMGKNVLKLEELEAIRLKDLEGLEQEECATKMEVSRPTFQRILISAREKVADSLINGKTILIEGGNFTLNICPVICTDCGKEWTERYEDLGAVKRGRAICPYCGSRHVTCKKSCRGKSCPKGCCRRLDP